MCLDRISFSGFPRSSTPLRKRSTCRPTRCPLSWEIHRKKKNRNTNATKIKQVPHTRAAAQAPAERERSRSDSSRTDEGEHN